jgi:HAE1 family hydrophobic/amphiphilic exporter-1
MSREPLAYALPRFSVNRPVTVVMILAALLVVGAIAYHRIPLALFPEGYEEKALGVFVPYPNASPRDIEQKIARPVEDIIGTMSGVRRLRTFVNQGSCFVRVEFQGGVDLQLAYATLRDRMDRVMADLPDDVDRIWVRRWDQNDIPILFLVATLAPGSGDPFWPMDTYVRPALQRIEGVGNVNIWGIDRREIRIELIEDRVRSHGIDVYQLVERLRDQNFNLGGGHVIEGGRKVYVRSLGQLESLEQIENLVVDPATRLRVADIARVSLATPRREWVYRVDQRPAVGIEITRESSGNIERMSREVRAALRTLEGDPSLAGIRFDVFWDQGKHVRESIDTLRTSGVWGGMFAALIIYAFLRAPRMTGILTLAIPLSLLSTIVVLFFMGWSLNMATMMGLLLSVGLVVDNAIVIVENIYRRRQEGQEARAASIVGAGEVGLAVTMATLTTVVVFLPLILMNDDAEFSFWMLRIGVPVVTSLLASLAIALIFVPLAAQQLSRGRVRQELAPIVWLRRRYLVALRWVLSHRLDAALLVLLALCTLPIVSGKVKRAQGGGGDGENNMWFFFDLPSGLELEKADQFFTSVEEHLLARMDRYRFDRLETRFRHNFGRVQARFRPDPHTEWYAHAWNSLLVRAGHRPAPMEREEIEKEFREQFELPAGVTFRTTWRDRGEDAGLRLNLYGEDTTQLIALAAEVERRLRTIPGLLSIETDMERGGTELQVQIDRDRARQLGVEPQTVSGGITYSMRGLELGRYYSPDGRELRIQLQLEDGDQRRLDELRTMTFRTESGVDVPLESLAELSVGRTLGQIRREARQTMLSVTARAPRDDARQLFQQVEAAMEGFEMPRGYRWDRGARYSRLEESNRAQQFALLLAVTFVFLLMGVLFESFVLPLAVIIAVPFSFLGVFWMLYLTGTALDVMAMIGTVILVGVVVNNAIVLVDLTNRLRAAGRPRFEALLEAGTHRFRPILMTTCTTIFGLVPMALGNAKMIGMPYAPLGRTMIGGLLASTLLTLLIVPLFYTLLDDLRHRVAAAVRTALQRGHRAAPAASSGVPSPGVADKA